MLPLAVTVSPDTIRQRILKDVSPFRGIMEPGSFTRHDPIEDTESGIQMAQGSEAVLAAVFQGWAKEWLRAVSEVGEGVWLIWRS